MSFNLGSEPSATKANAELCLTPMSFNLGSERSDCDGCSITSLTPMSFNLGSEPLFSNLYLIVT